MTATTPRCRPSSRAAATGSSSARPWTPCPSGSPWRRPSKLSHAEFLELVLADEVDRRNRQSAALRAKTARLDPAMTLQAWDPDANVTYDQAMWAELTSLRFLDDAHNALILGPVGVGKTHLAHALGHIACRRGHKVHAERADRLFKRLKPPGSTTPTTPNCAG
jgi:DNA replication protein DnaC